MPLAKRAVGSAHTAAGRSIFNLLVSGRPPACSEGPLPPQQKTNTFFKTAPRLRAEKLRVTAHSSIVRTAPPRSAVDGAASRAFYEIDGSSVAAGDRWAGCVAGGAHFPPIFPSECNQKACASNVRMDAHAEESQRLRGKFVASDG